MIRLARRRAVEEDRPLSDVLQETLVAYLGKRTPDPKKREEAYRTFCEQPIRISRDQLDATLKEDTWAL